MVINKKAIILISLFLVFLGGCSINNNSSNFNQILKKEKSTFGIETNKSNLLEHFPNKIKNNNLGFYISPPYCPPPPTCQCRAQFGYIYLNVVKTDYKKDLTKLLNGKIMYKTTYYDSNIIINLLDMRRTLFPVKKCNKWYANKLPIPYFESYDFGLGQKETSKKVEGETYFNYTYTIPKDLKVYVIKAEPGNFWKFDCKENRPETLGKWKHGYSKGVAVSEKNNKVVFWVMVW